MSEPLVSHTGRSLALVIGPFYIHTVAIALSAETKTPYAIAIVLTVAGALAIMAVLTVFGVKAYQYEHAVLRFTLSTVFFVVIPISLYLAAIRWFLQKLPTTDLTLAGQFWILFFSLLWMFTTTVILLWLAEAIMAIAAGVARWRASRRYRHE